VFVAAGEPAGGSSLWLGLAVAFVGLALFLILLLTRKRKA